MLVFVFFYSKCYERLLKNNVLPQANDNKSMICTSTSQHWLKEVKPTKI